MGMLTIRNIDDELKAQLRLKAAAAGCSMEEAARRILREAMRPDARRTEARELLFERLASQPALGARNWTRDDLYD
ncbi:MAG TPA: plasmid stabilization protein [Burkholderiaceae bacterium]|nr:plasmid stabilization protein [Burkholderiaceae bacterium]HMX11082.1 plasmid stabilization protein [Burkholderiaceae bacterium]HMY99076.1 plasmid stabilization protein [Burkholderiaceae bacterium]HNG81845.1 plasmid stabilization protein [Burkholderiaceae bacterium]